MSERGVNVETELPVETERGLPLLEIERALRPLRRVLARDAAARAGADVYFAVNCARLAAPLRTLRWPVPIDETARELTEAFDGIETVDGPTRSERVTRAWQVLQRLDGILGLPLQEAIRYEPKVRRPPVERAEPARPALEVVPGGAARPAPSRPAAAPVAPVAPVAASAEPRPSGPAALLLGARFDTALADLDLPDALVDAAGEVGLETVWDVLTLPPVGTEVVAPVHGAGRPLPPGRVAVGGRVRARFTTVAPDGAARSRLVLQGAGRVVVHWSRPFGAAELLRAEPGAKVVVVGTAEGEEVVDAGLAASAQGKAIRTRYDASDPDGVVPDLVRLLLEGVEGLEDPLPGAVVERRGLRPLGDAVARVHTRPGDEEGRRRLAFDEALHLSLGLSQARFDGPAEPGISHAIVHQHVAELPSRAEVAPLNDAQQAVLEAIKRDLKAAAPMQRLLCGPASAGVDEVVLQVLLTAAESRSQVLVVAPDAPSSAVLAGRWEPVLRSFGLVALHVTGEPRRADRDALRRGEVHVAFGSPSVFELGLEWRRLGLVLGYEQARYGELPARVAAMRAPRPDLLVVTRTPPPAHVLLGAYPTLDVSALPEPAATPAPATLWREAERELAYQALGAAVREGRQVLVAFPMRRGGTDLLALREAELLVDTLRAQFLGDLPVAIFHGALGTKERQRAWTDFVELRAKAIVATTTIEMMPPFPRGVVGLVEHADRVDPQRLLGLRALLTPAGHLHCVVGAEPNPRGLARVARLVDQVRDAEVVADGDVHEIVDGGAVAPRFRWLDATRDVELLLAARAEAHALLRQDPGLRSGNAPRLLRLVHRGWTRLLPDRPPPLPLPREPAPGSKKKRRRRRRR